MLRCTVFHLLILEIWSLNSHLSSCDIFGLAAWIKPFQRSHWIKAKDLSRAEVRHECIETTTCMGWFSDTDIYWSIPKKSYPFRVFFALYRVAAPERVLWTHVIFPVSKWFWKSHLPSTTGYFSPKKVTCTETHPWTTFQVKDVKDKTSRSIALIHGSRASICTSPVTQRSWHCWVAYLEIIWEYIIFENCHRIRKLMHCTCVKGLYSSCWRTMSLGSSRSLMTFLVHVTASLER